MNEQETCLICTQPITNPTYKKYSVCSSKCEAQAQVDEDRGRE